MNHFSIDIETLALTPGAAILSIGACIFDPIYEKIVKPHTFYDVISLESNTEWGRDINPDTMRWWGDQDEDVRNETMNGKTHIEDALKRFANYVYCHQSEESKFWANDPQFDLVILESAFSQAGMKFPWTHRQPRSFRTIVDLADYEAERREGNHRAVDDAVNQAHDILACYKILKG